MLDIGDVPKKGDDDHIGAGDDDQCPLVGRGLDPRCPAQELVQRGCIGERLQSGRHVGRGRMEVSQERGSCVGVLSLLLFDQHASRRCVEPVPTFKPPEIELVHPNDTT